MITFSVPKDLLLYSHEMGTPSDFSVRGFPAGQSEDGSSMAVAPVSFMGATDPYISSVVLLLNATGVQGNTTIQPQIGPPLTRGGDTHIDRYSDVPAILFDASGDYLHTGSVTSLVTVEDFCIEAIISHNTRSTDTWGRIIYSQYDYGTESANRTLFSIYDDGTIRFQRGSFVLSSTQLITLGVNYHVAVTRESGTIRLWIDGQKVAESTSFSGSLSPVFSCISGLYYYGYKASFAGRIYALRVTKGLSRYTENFTSPIAPFPTL